MDAIILSNDQYRAILNKIEEINLRLQPSSKSIKDLIIDNDDFISTMKIASRTAQRWRDEGKISFSQVGAKIYYTQADIEMFLKKHYNNAFASKSSARLNNRITKKSAAR
jgi:succinate dehydrogenase/fumarate reductase-like Fe-S protein